MLGAPDLELTAALGGAAAPAIGTDAGAALGRACGVIVHDDVDEALRGADVLIDFTRPDGTVIHAAACAMRGVALVAGTTGMCGAQKYEVA